MKPRTIPAKPACWITEESARRLKDGGNDSRGTVPVHHQKSSTANIPLFTEDELNNVCIQAYTMGVINAERVKE